MIAFYYGSGSPYAWRVWLALEQKRIPYELKLQSFSSGDLKTPEYLAINPRGRVPAIRDNGFALFESVAIMEYLDEAYDSGVPLYPGDAKRRATVRRLVQEADQYYAIAMERIVDQVLFTPQERWDLAAIAAARSGLAQELDRWERCVTGAFHGGGLHALSLARIDTAHGEEEVRPRSRGDDRTGDSRMDPAHGSAADRGDDLAAPLESGLMLR